MKVCACGQTMLKDEPWCKLCWARWSTWFMRALGTWYDLEYRRVITVKPCDCVACMLQHAQQHGADVDEDINRIKYDAARR